MTMESVVPFVCTVVCLIFTGAHGLTQNEIKQFKSRSSTYSTQVSLTVSGNVMTLKSNGIPDHVTGKFPARFNPNKIETQAHEYTIPTKPMMAPRPIKTTMGPIGFAVNGVPFYNAYTSTGQDAVKVEVFDQCSGHPDRCGRYHYHKHPECVGDRSPNQFLGVARDGFPIYGPIDENGKILRSADLDDCHGRYYKGQYRYHITSDYPYIIGCFRGRIARKKPAPCAGNKGKP